MRVPLVLARLWGPSPALVLAVKAGGFDWDKVLEVTVFLTVTVLPTHLS